MKSIGSIIKSRKQNQNRGFVMIPNSFIETKNLSIYEKMTVIVMLKHKGNNETAWPSQQRLASQVGCSISTIKKTIIGLENKKIVSKLKSKNYRRNIYQIKLNNR
jgi:DNA-binding MarR family transcriptional regulator